MGQCYSHLDLAERRTIALLWDAKIPVGEIAVRLGRHRSSIHREINRNFYHTRSRDRHGLYHRGYYAVAAHMRAQQRRTSLSKLKRHPALLSHIVERLHDGWSPEQIAGRLRIMPDALGRISHETIYRYVYSNEGPLQRLFQMLATARRRRRPRFGRKPRKSTIPAERWITARPDDVADRTVFGHWEGDLIIVARKHGKANVTALLERQSRYVLLAANDDRHAGPVAHRIAELFANLPANARQTLTLDRGTEFMSYLKLHLDCYFCDPHSPWQKGAVENSNGRLRRLLPLDSPVTTRTPKALNLLAKRLNNTPRRCLGFRTPHEVFSENLAQLRVTA